MATYYAIRHRYSADMRDDAGNMIGIIHEFATAKARDAWVDEDNAYHCNSDGRRERLSRSNSRERRAIEHALLSNSTVTQAERDYLVREDA